MDFDTTNTLITAFVLFSAIFLAFAKPPKKGHYDEPFDKDETLGI